MQQSLSKTCVNFFIIITILVEQANHIAKKIATSMQLASVPGSFSYGGTNANATTATTETDITVSKIISISKHTTIN